MLQGGVMHNMEQLVIVAPELLAGFGTHSSWGHTQFIHI